MSVHLMVASPIAGCLGRETIAACMEVRGLGTDDPRNVTCSECLAMLKQPVRVIPRDPADAAKAEAMEATIAYLQGKLSS